MATPTFGMYVSPKSYVFTYLDCSYNVRYVYNNWSIWARIKIVRRKDIIQPTGLVQKLPAILSRPQCVNLRKQHAKR